MTQKYSVTLKDLGKVELDADTVIPPSSSKPWWTWKKGDKNVAQYAQSEVVGWLLEESQD